VPTRQEHATAPSGPDPAPWTIEVADGSGNVTTFRATEDGEVTWHYDPVTPAESSSGTYSGGEPARGSLSAAQVDALWRFVRDTKGREPGRGRAMGTFLVQVESPAGRRGVVVSSADARDLDEWVRALRR